MLKTLRTFEQEYMQDSVRGRVSCQIIFVLKTVDKKNIKHSESSKSKWSFLAWYRRKPLSPSPSRTPLCSSISIPFVYLGGIIFAFFTHTHTQTNTFGNNICALKTNRTNHMSILSTTQRITHFFCKKLCASSFIPANNETAHHRTKKSQNTGSDCCTQHKTCKRLIDRWKRKACVNKRMRTLYVSSSRHKSFCM